MKGRHRSKPDAPPNDGGASFVNGRVTRRAAAVAPREGGRHDRQIPLPSPVETPTSDLRLEPKGLARLVESLNDGGGAASATPADLTALFAWANATLAASARLRAILDGRADATTRAGHVQLLPK